AGAGPRPRARCRALGPGSEPGAVGAVQRRGDRLEGGAGDRPVDAHAPEDPVPDLALAVGGGQRVVALGQGVLGVIEAPHVDLPLGERLDEAVQRALRRPETSCSSTSTTRLTVMRSAPSPVDSWRTSRKP